VQIVRREAAERNFVSWPLFGYPQGPMGRSGQGGIEPRVDASDENHHDSAIHQATFGTMAKRLMTDVRIPQRRIDTGACQFTAAPRHRRACL